MGLPVFKVSALYCPLGRTFEWMTTDLKAGELLLDALRKSDDFADAKMKKLGE